MDIDKMKERVFKVMSSVFGVPVDKINEESSPDNIESWDSLKHLNLVVALEEEFDIEFTDDQTGDIMSALLIIKTLEKIKEDL